MYPLSDARFERFDVHRMRRTSNNWSQPEWASFNSKANEHGVSYSPDGRTLYFCSTRPVPRPEVASTWHLRKCLWDGEQWLAAT